MAERPSGSRLGIDWGKVRIGVAACGAGVTLCHPVETVPAGSAELDRLEQLVAEYEPALIYVGLPLTLAGERSHAADFVIARARRLAARLPDTPVRLVDERLSTASASRTLGESGRGSRQLRPVIDQAAAVEILQRAVDVELASGGFAGLALD